MASFTESATLKINDQSSKQIAGLNKELRGLFATANRMRKLSTLDLSSLKAAQRDVKAIGRVLNQLPKSRTISVNVNQRGSTPRVSTAGIIGGGRGGRGGGLLTSAGKGFSGAISRLTVSGAATFTGAVTISSLALQSLNASQAQDTRERIALSPAQRNFVNDAAERAALGAPRIGITRAREIAFDQLAGGTPERVLSAQTKLAANAEVVADNVVPGLGRSLTTLTNKFVNLANSNDDVVRSTQLVSGITRGAIATGESFKPDTQIAQFRLLGSLTGTLNEKGVFNLTQLFDASTTAAKGLNRLQKELFTPTEQAGAGSGIAKGAVANLNQRGLRGFTSEQAALFNRDPLSFIEQVLAKRIQSQGVDTNNRDQLSNFLKTAGFNQTSQNVINQVLQSVDERNRQFNLTRNVDVSDPTKGTEGNLRLATLDLIASFNTLSAKVLTPIAESVAPAITSVASLVEKTALTGSNFDRLALTAGTAAAALGVFKVGQFGLAALFNPLNQSALALDGSAAALTRAAVSLGGSGVAGTVGTAAGAATAGASTGLAARALSLISQFPAIAGLAAATTLGRGSVQQLTPYQLQLLYGTPDGKPRAPFQGPPAPAGMTPDRISALNSFLDMTVPTQIEQAFGSGAGELRSAGSDAGQNFLSTAATFFEGAGAAGAAFGQSAAAAFNANVAAQVGLSIPRPTADTGGNSKTEGR
ncbi:hypothetical protein [Rhizobium sp. BG4]|uniref:hypothetical protein n=1 Tax=Rhizobium sp. BG4 TaxID=2613770 RepID=UPI00193D232C|nr:hypothetical protein [Rhizobium sp. BG4]QRM45344.1 hypothetical protein F2982_19000 [Rhizobium sp. BG4]